MCPSTHTHTVNDKNEIVTLLHRQKQVNIILLKSTAVTETEYVTLWKSYSC